MRATFGDRLRAARVARRLTQETIAEITQVPTRSYQKYEEGASYPSIDRLIKLADALDVSTDYLLGRDEYLSANDIIIDIPEISPVRRSGGHQRT